MRERQPPHTRGVSKVARAVWEGPLPPARLRASDLLVSREQASFSCLLLSGQDHQHRKGWQGL